MKNYKQALFNAINDSTTEPRAYLDGYSQNFINDHYATSSQYICDAISEFADANTSIHYSNIKEYICNNFDKVEEAINEFGWDGCGRDIYKAGQMAEYMSIEQEIYNELEDIIKYITLDFIDSTDEASDEAERVWGDLADEIKYQLLDEFIYNLENLDNNGRLDEISDLYNNFVQAILDTEESDSVKN